MSMQPDVGRQSKAMAVAIVLLVVAIGYVASTYFFGRTATPSKVSKIQTSGKGTESKESEQYTQLLNKYNDKNADKALEKGDTYVSALSERVQDVPIEQPKPEPKPPTIIYNYPKPDPQVEQHKQKEVAVQMESLVNAWTPVPHTSARVSADSIEYAKSISTENDWSQIQQVTSDKIKVVEDFALVPAILQTAIDTDENSVVRAYIPTGKYKGAVLFAMGYRRLSETVDMTFTYMQWQGRSYKVTAKAVDQDTMRTALSGEVNNRYFSRIILPALAAGIGKAGQLYEQSGTRNVITPQGGVIQTYPENPEWRQVTGTVVGGIGRHAGNVLANDAANLPVKQVLVERGTTIGIQFIGPVLASDDLAEGAQQLGGSINAGTGAARVAQAPRGVAVAPPAPANNTLEAVSAPAGQPPHQQIVPPTIDYTRPPPNIPGYIPPDGY